MLIVIVNVILLVCCCLGECGMLQNLKGVDFSAAATSSRTGHHLSSFLCIRTGLGCVLGDIVLNKIPEAPIFIYQANHLLNIKKQDH
jgi:hypothetical protein